MLYFHLGRRLLFLLTSFTIKDEHQKTVSVNANPATVGDLHLVQKVSVCLLKQLLCSLQLFILDFQVKFKVQSISWVQDIQETSLRLIAKPVVNK